MTLGDIVKTRREQAGMSLQDLADASGCTKAHVWEIEQGKTSNIGLHLAIRLSIALGIPVNALAAASLETN